MKTTIGGDRLGSGNKQEVSLKNYERSTHDIGYTWRSSMSSGTLVPFMSEVGLPGDSFDIDLSCDVKTLPTIGPLFGSYKVQLDVFECPIRLYNGKLHMNMLNIGMDMSKIKLPQIKMGAYYDKDEVGDNTQVNPSSIFGYLNIRGLGRRLNAAGTVAENGVIEREFNAVPFLGYWEIYKNYYANKQQEIGAMIHASNQKNYWELDSFVVELDGGQAWGTYAVIENDSIDIDTTEQGGYLPGVYATAIYSWAAASPGTQAYGEPKYDSWKMDIDGTEYSMNELWTQRKITYQNDGRIRVDYGYPNLDLSGYQGPRVDGTWEPGSGFYDSEYYVENTMPGGLGEPQIEEFPLDRIDGMREDILKAVSQTSAFLIDGDDDNSAPYGISLLNDNDNYGANAFCLSSQEGLGLKTYQSDLLNNWISTEWIDGTNGINDITSVLVTQNLAGDDVITIDAMNMQSKVYTMLNRIAISGGSYDDWLDAVYTHERAKSVESPVYHGSLIKELAFEEVISNADTEDQEGNQQPLGTLAGRGRLTGKNKGGKIKIKVSEPCYIMGIVSITPRVDYSQGNKWDVNLKSLNDLHKPELSEIGYQDLVMDQASWFSTGIIGSGSDIGDLKYQVAGKQPAWINYMTNINQTRGEFAVGSAENEVGQMFMTLNRRYEQDKTGIVDMTTYIDPSKFNNIFAQTSVSSQNFWTQIGCDITARRKMSAKVIPNL